MASEGIGKLKHKRNQPNKPYERKSSLLRKLKDSVKDLLIPSWLSGTPSKQKPDNITARHCIEDTSRLGVRAGQVSTEWSHGSAFQTDRLAPGDMSIPYGNSTGKLPASNIPGFGYQPPNGDLPTDQSTSLTVDSSSLNLNLASHAQQLIPNLKAGKVLPKSSDPAVVAESEQRHFGPIESHHHDFDVTPIRPIMVSTGVKSSAKQDAKRQRLWSPEPLRQGRPLVPPPRGKPSFNSLLFGTPSKGDTSISSSFGDSSFYVGKTCYGGASSAKRKPLNTTLPYQSSLPLRKQVKAKNMNSSFNATTSSTAQRILDTLERMSTPLEDAKKMPQADQGNDSVLSFTPSSYRRQSYQCSVKPITRPLQLPNRGPPTSQLQNTSHVEIARNRDRSLPKKPASESVLSITQEMVSTKESVKNVSTPLMSSTCKMKSKKFSQHISGRQEEEVMTTPNLRTDFTLPFSAMAPIVLSSGSDKSHMLPTVTAVTSKSGGTSPLKFTFATPIEEKNRPIGSQFGRQPGEGFKFSSPIHVSPSKTSAAGAEEGSKPSPEPAVGAANPQSSTWAPQMMKPKALSPDIGGTSSSFKSYTKWNGSQKNETPNVSAISLPAVTTLKKGSVMDILGAGKDTSSDLKKGQSDNMPLSSLFKKPPGSWECDTCMVQNTANTTRCVACSALKPGSKSNHVLIGNQDKPPLSDLFKKPEGSWECSTCMIQNDASTNKCVACTTPKTASKTEEKGKDSGSVPLSQLFKKAEGTWECDTCLIQNSPSCVKCVACETPKPGAKTDSGNVPLNQLFKKAEGTWECDICLVQNTPSSVKCAACETPKPGAKSAPPPNKSNNSLAAMFKKPEGSWECDTCMVQNSSTTLRCIACDSSKPGLQSAGIVSKPSSGGLSFNLPSTTTTTTGSAGFKFGNTSASVKSSDAVPVNTGFSFGNNSSKDNSSVNNSSSTTKTMPMGGGFQIGTQSSVTSNISSGLQFGAAAASSATISSNSNVNISSGAFHFGAPVTSSNASPTSSVGFSLGTTIVSKSSGFQFGAPTTSCDVSTGKSELTFNESSHKAASSSSQSLPSSISSSVSFASLDNTNKLNTAAALGGFKFGSNASAPSAIVPVDKKTETCVPSQSTFTFGTTTTATKNQAGPFVFGAPVSSSQSSVGLGMGQSLAQSTEHVSPLVNGAFGAGQSSKNALESTNTGFSASASGFTFGSKQPSSQITMTKRSVDSSDMEGPNAKAPAFGSLSKEPTVNGGFNFNANAGSFTFGSSQPSQPTAGAFQFSAAPAVNPSGPAAPATGFSFTAKQPGQEAQAVKKNEVSFNFSAAPADGNASFPFGSKAAPETASSNMFTFGASSNPAIPQPNAAPMFGASPAGTNAVGGFSIGADTSQRKMKKAVRRIKPR